MLPALVQELTEAFRFVDTDNGWAVQVDPIKPTLKSPGCKSLKLEHDDLLSNFAFNFQLRRYTTVGISTGPSSSSRPAPW
jgi:hypothetical protein